MMMERVRHRERRDRGYQEHEERLEALFRTDRADLVRLAYVLVHSSAEAEELVQDAFLEVLRRGDDIRDPKAYLRSSVVSRCRSLLRHRRVVSLHPLERPDDLPESAGELWDVVSKLPDDQRIAVVLRYYAGYRASEIAEIVDRPASTVRTRLRRATARLNVELSS